MYIYGSLNQIVNIQKLADLNNLLNQIPNTDLILNADQINAILKSCPGAFPDIPSINLMMFEGIKDYLNFLKINPLGKISGFMDSLNSIMVPVNDTIAQLRNYATCLRNLCDYVDFENKWQEISNIEEVLNLDDDGNPQILDDVAKSTTAEYTSRVNSLTETMENYKNSS